MHNVVFGYAIDPEFDRKEAVRLLRLALSLDDSDAETLALVCVTSAFMVGDSEAETEMADRAVALNPNSYLAWTNRGWVHNIAGLPEEAVRSFERAIRMSPVDPALHRSFLLGCGWPLLSFVALTRQSSQGREPNVRTLPSTAYRCLASSFAHLGRDAEAREAAARQLELDPAITISARIARGGQSNAKLLIEGLRKAGLPE